MRAKNHVIYADRDTLRRLKDEYEYLGRVCELREDRLIVFAVPPVKKKSEKREKKYGGRR